LRRKTDLADLVALQESLGVSFNEPSQLRQALIHSSYLNENPGSAPTSNERLEFLGDAVLGVVITEKLYQELPEATEGEMTKLRAALVSRDTLARLARTAGLGNYLYLGKGEETSGGRDKPANLASTLEAVIAAAFLDQGPHTTRDLILRLFKQELKTVISQGDISNYKTQLQELLQARGQSLPFYHLLEAKGPEHEPQFTVEVHSGDTILGQGSGKSKKQAEARAARSALESFSNGRY
jgi:ribonuclease-3